MPITRPNFEHDLKQLPPQYTLIYWQQTTEGTTWHLMNQAKKWEPSSKAGAASNKRVGSVSAFKTRGAVEHSLNLAVYYEDDLKELAAVLGMVIPAGGWDGVTKIRLDGTKKVNLKAVTFSSADAGADELFTEIAMAFGVTELKTAVDSDNENARVAELSGECDDYYKLPV